MDDFSNLLYIAQYYLSQLSCLISGTIIFIFVINPIAKYGQRTTRIRSGLLVILANFSDSGGAGVEYNLAVLFSSPIVLVLYMVIWGTT